jgi:hypothetical protein
MRLGVEERCLELDTLARRLRVVAERDDRLRLEAAKLLEAAAIRGEIERREASRITGLPARTAKQCRGIDVPDHRLLATGTKSVGYFASKRFDLARGGVRRHMVSVAVVLDIDWTVLRSTTTIHCAWCAR